MYAVFGNKIYHSLTPNIYEQFGLNATRIKALSLDHINDIIENFNLNAFNITSPFKSDFYEYLDEKDDTVENTGFVNFVKIENGFIKGYNTDYLSLINYDEFLQSKILIFGAGSISKLIVFRANNLNCKKIYIFNRTIEKTNEIVHKCKNCVSANISDLSDIISNVDTIINTSPILSVEILKLIKENVSIKTKLLDINYNKPPLGDLSLKYESGKNWFINQALESIKLINSENILKKDIELSDRINPKNFILTGFPGSGKTTVGKLLAQRLNYKFIDIDEEIIKKTGKKISKIFNEFGEGYFRELETAEIQKLSDAKNYIISIGGGALEFNKILLKNIGEQIFLNCELNNCIERINHSDRPLKEKYNEKLYKSRSNDYFANSDLVIDANGNVNDIVGMIYEEINNAFNS